MKSPHNVLGAWMGSWQRRIQLKGVGVLVGVLKVSYGPFHVEQSHLVGNAMILCVSSCVMGIDGYTVAA